MKLSRFTFIIIFILSWGCKPVASPSDSEVKIINGEVVSDSDPALFSTLFIQSSDGGACTGTLIGPNHISTAAHCFSPNSRVASIGYGRNMKTVSGIQNFRHIIHEQYGGSMMDESKDIALIIFDGALPTELRPVAVGTDADVSLGREVIFAGYGLTSSNQFAQADGQLRVVRSKIGEIDAANGEIMDEVNGKGTCFGDSGGPMYIESGTSSLKVIGATSRGSNNCEIGDGIYTNLPFYRKWMADAFTKLGKPLSYLSDGSEPSWGGGKTVVVAIDTLLP